LQKLLIGSNSIMSKDTVFNSLFVIIWIQACKSCGSINPVIQYLKLNMEYVSVILPLYLLTCLISYSWSKCKNCL
jgi:hypothetical protein